MPTPCGEAMYGLPPNTDVSFLNGKLLRQVCIGFNEIILRFDDNVTLTAQTDIGHRSGGIITAIYKHSMSVAPVVVKLLHKAVVSASCQQPGTLILDFGDDEGLEFYDSSPQYESYTINNNNVLIVV